jgi:hypothetical protein
MEHDLQKGKMYRRQQGVRIMVFAPLLFDSGILLIIDLNKKKGKKGGGEFYL